MRSIFAFVFIISALTAAFGQNEQAPIVEKEFSYRDWTYKNLKGGGETNLREFARGKKLVMVVYWAPWCLNWRHDVAFVQELHSKYAKDGLAVIGVGEYDSAERMKQHYEQFKLTFPSVYESTALSERLKTVHYEQRTAAGDTRKWGSPWYVFLEPAALEQSGEFLTKKTAVVNGELVKQDAEKYIRQKLGVSAVGGVSEAASGGRIEICDPAKKTAELVKAAN